MVEWITSPLLTAYSGTRRREEMRREAGFAVSAIFLMLLGSILCINLAAPTTGAASSTSPEVNYIRYNTTIDNNYAVTQITEEFYNPNNYSVDDTFSIRIPEKAFISNFSLTIDGETHYAEVVSKQLAKEQYNAAVTSGQDAGLVESYGKYVFSYSVSLSPYQTIRVGLSYEQFLEKTLGGYTYKIFLTSGNIDSDVRYLEINIDIDSELDITEVAIPDRKGYRINYPDKTQAVITYFSENLPEDHDFTVYYELAGVNLNGKILNYNDGFNGYFAHVFSPQQKDLGGSPMPKDIIFVLDKSGSMSGTKITQLKDAFDEVVHELRAEDRFNIIMFSSDISKYQTQMIDASEGNQDEAAVYINGISAGGSTDINKALLTGLDMFTDTAETVPIIVFLTDGLPTYGITSTSTIRNNIQSANEDSVAIFSLGFGYDVDFNFLKALSLENYGHALRIEEGADASDQITDFYETISTPLLKNIQFDYPENYYDIYPSYVEQMFEGSEVVVVGRYNLMEKQISSNIYATANDGKRTFSQTMDLQQESTFDFIPRLWAYTKINYLLDRITVEGETEDLVGQVVTLAMEYQFVTPYTSLLITIEEKKEGEKKEEGTETGEPPETLGTDPKDPDTGSGTNSNGPDASTTTGAPMQPAPDTDGDGVADNYDAYPYDPTEWDRSNYYSPAPDGGGDANKKEDADISEAMGSSSLLCIPILIIGGVLFIVVIAILISRKKRQI